MVDTERRWENYARLALVPVATLGGIAAGNTIGRVLGWLNQGWYLDWMPTWWLDLLAGGFAGWLALQLAVRTAPRIYHQRTKWGTGIGLLILGGFLTWPNVEFGLAEGEWSPFFTVYGLLLVVGAELFPWNRA